MRDTARLRAAVTMATHLAARAWRRQVDEALAQYGLSEATAWPLVHLSRLGDGIRQGQLAEVMGIEGPSLVRLLDHLCAAGLVRRREDPGDRRARTLHLTDSGRALVARIETVVARLRGRVLADASAEELEACLRVLGMLQDAVGTETEPA